jgi:hypothetical protein
MKFKFLETISNFLTSSMNSFMSIFTTNFFSNLKIGGSKPKPANVEAPKNQTKPYNECKTAQDHITLILNW